MTRMKEMGVELPVGCCRLATLSSTGALTISDEIEPELHRVVKVARLALDTGDRVLELLEPQMHGSMRRALPWAG
jgi:hypothetical protein